MILLALLFLAFTTTEKTLATPIKDSKQVMTPQQGLKKSSWKQKLEERLLQDADYLEQKLNLEIAQKKESQSFYSWTPELQVYGSQVATPELKAFSQTQLGLSAQLNLFQFGKDYYLYQSRKTATQAQKIEFNEKSIAIENQYLGLLFKNIYLRKKIEYYQEIETLKRKTLKVAEQRFDRGNLARQQVEKVTIDLNNFESQKLNLEKELDENELLVKKFDLQSFERVWPFVDFKETTFQKITSDSSAQFKKMQLESEQANQFTAAVKSGYLPSLDLSGRYYKYMEDSHLPNQWEMNLVLTWKLWDNFSYRLSYLDAFKNQISTETRLAQLNRIQPEQNQFYFNQLESSQKKLKKSFSSLNKLNDLYQDTERLFSQGRLTVNELFQDQQLLMETRINFENDVYDFHQSLLNYCTQKSQRVWQCLEF